MKIIENTNDLFRLNPIFGSGIGTYSFLVNDLTENDLPIRTFSGNSLTQLIVEQGLVGTLLCGLSYICFLIIFIRNIRNDFLNLILIAILLSFLIKEMTFPSLWDNKAVQVLILILLAVGQNLNVPKELSFSIKSSRVRLLIVVIPILSSIVISWQLYSHYTNERFNRDFLVALEAGQPDEALTAISKTPGSIPYLIHRSLGYWNNYLIYEDTLSMQKAKQLLLKICNDYQNTNLHYLNLAVIYEYEGKLDSTFILIQQLIDKYPQNPLYLYRGFYNHYFYGNKILSRSYLCKAILEEPFLLETRDWEKIKKNDQDFASDVISTLESELKNFTIDPIMWAKRGKIYYNIGRLDMAECYYRQALEVLPNLMQPWLYLSKIEQTRHNKDSAEIYMNRYYLLSKRGNDEVNVIPDFPFKADYLIKYNMWYGSNTSSTKILFRTVHDINPFNNIDHENLIP